MVVIDYKDIIRFQASLPNPFSVEALPFISWMHRFSSRRRRRGLSKRIIGKPAKWLFASLMKIGISGTGTLRIQTPNGEKAITFNARNTQFSALYQPEYQPLYEIEVSAVLNQLVQDRDTFYDVGSNWGWHSILLAVRPSFQGSIHAFEPFPSTFADLVTTVRQAGLDAHIHCHQIALSNEDTTGEMALPDGIHSGLAKVGTSGGITAKLARLDNLDLPPPNVIKIDTEDHELAVLLGAAKIIDKVRPFIVFENGLRRDQPKPTFEPIMYLMNLDYKLFYPAWVTRHENCIIWDPANFVPDDTNFLALVPFMPFHRALLGPLINIVAIPGERTVELHQRFS